MDTKKIISKLANISDKLGLKYEISPTDYFARKHKGAFITPATDKNNKKVIFRISFSDYYNRAFARETSIYKEIKKLNLQYFPEIVNAGVLGGYNWLCYEYINGEPAGNTYQFKNTVDFNSVLDFMVEIEKLGQKLDRNLFRKFIKDDWLKLINEITNKSKDLASSEWVRISKIIDSIPEKFDLAFVHGDFHPQNILITSSGVKVIDWEASHFNLKPYDYSYIWIRCYNDQIREKIISILDNSGTDVKTINFVFAVNLLRDYFEWHLIQKDKNEFVRKSEIINSASTEEIMDDLRKNFYHFVEKL